MRRVVALLVSLLLLTACTPRALYGAYQERRLAEEMARSAPVMALVTVGDRLPSYLVGGEVYTDTEVAVIRGRNVQPGAKLTLRRHGGQIEQPGGMARLVTVDYAYYFPEKGAQVFLLLRQVGEKYEIIDAMAVQGGEPLSKRPANQVYLGYLRSLE